MRCRYDLSQIKDRTRFGQLGEDECEVTSLTRRYCLPRRIITDVLRVDQITPVSAVPIKKISRRPDPDVALIPRGSHDAVYDHLPLRLSESG